MNLFPKTVIAGVATVGAGLITLGAAFDENARALMYTGMTGTIGAAIGSTIGALSEDTHFRVLRDEVLGATLGMVVSTAMIETHPHTKEAFHGAVAKTVVLDAVPKQRVPHNTYVM